MRVLAIVLCCVLASACSPFIYKIDVQQGNYVTQDVLDKVKVGMTKTEVRQVMGTPLLNDVFHADRWDYYFSSYKKGRQAGEPKRITLLFKDEKLQSFSGEAFPPAPPPVAAPPASVR